MIRSVGRLSMCDLPFVERAQPVAETCRAELISQNMELLTEELAPVFVGSVPDLQRAFEQRACVVGSAEETRDMDELQENDGYLRSIESQATLVNAEHLLEGCLSLDFAPLWGRVPATSCEGSRREP